MSLITRCPACRTMFKVVPDQLRISDGWVRCGQCDEVFDASAHLQEAVPVERELPPAPSDPSEEDAPFEPLDLDLDVEGGESPDAFVVSLEVPDPVSSGEPLLDAYADVQQMAQIEPAVVDAYGESPETELLAKPEETPSFMREPRGQSRALSTRARWVLRGVAVFLSTTLLVQVLTHERDWIAAAAPVLTPVVKAVCAPMQCDVAPLRQIESVLIDSSSFNRVRTDVYRLNLTLKNAAAVNLALPALELTLTDSQDQAVIRRVFLARELGLPSEELVAGSEVAISLPLSVTPNGAAERFSGYRVLAFYP